MGILEQTKRVPRGIQKIFLFLAVEGILIKTPFDGYSIFGESSLVYLGVFLAIVVGLSVVASKKQKKGSFMENSAEYLTQPLRNAVNTFDVPLIRGLFRMFDIRDLTPNAGNAKEEWSFSIRKLWVEVMVSLNLMLRLGVHMGKRGEVTGKQELFEKAFEELDLKRFTTTYLDAALDLTRNGVLYVPRVGGGTETRPRPYKHVDLFSGNLVEGYYDNDFKLKTNAADGIEITEIGGNSHHDNLFVFFDQLKNAIEAMPDTPMRDPATEKKGHAEVLDDLIRDPNKFRVEQSKRALGYRKRRGILNKFHTYEPYLFDQYNAGGVKSQSFKFAKPKSPLQNYTVTFDLTKNQPYGVPHKVSGPTDMGIEIENDPIHTCVKSNGIFQDAYNDALFDNKDYFITTHGNKPPKYGAKNATGDPEVTRVHILQGVLTTDIVYHPEIWNMLTYLDAEWDGFIKDWRDGRFCFHSKTVSDYSDYHDRKMYNYTGLTRQNNGSPGFENPSFDREKLKDPGIIPYRGRNNIYDVDEPVLQGPPYTPFPDISTMGMSEYIRSFMNRFSDDAGNNQMKNFVWDDGTTGDVFTNFPAQDKP